MGELLGVDAVVLGLVAVDGADVEGVGQDEGEAGGLASVGQPLSQAEPGAQELQCLLVGGQSGRMPGRLPVIADGLLREVCGREVPVQQPSQNSAVRRVKPFHDAPDAFVQHSAFGRIELSVEPTLEQRVPEPVSRAARLSQPLHAQWNDQVQATLGPLPQIPGHMHRVPAQKNGSVLEFGICSSCRLSLAIQQVMNISGSPHLEALDNPFDRHHRLRPQPHRDRHLSRIPFCASSQLRLRDLPSGGESTKVLDYEKRQRVVRPPVGLSFNGGALQPVPGCATQHRDHPRR